MYEGRCYIYIIFIKISVHYFYIIKAYDERWGHCLIYRIPINFIQTEPKPIQIMKYTIPKMKFIVHQRF